MGVKEGADPCFHDVHELKLARGRPRLQVVAPVVEAFLILQP